MNHDCEPNKFMYKMVHKLEADSLEDAFKKSQNDFNEEYASKDIRSTSVGDIIMSHEDWQNSKCYLVKGIGFEEVYTGTWLEFFIWSTVESQAPDAATIADQQEEMKYLGD